MYLGISLSSVQSCQASEFLRPWLRGWAGRGCDRVKGLFSDLTFLFRDLQQVLPLHMLTDPCFGVGMVNAEFWPS